MIAVTQAGIGDDNRALHVLIHTHSHRHFPLTLLGTWACETRAESSRERYAELADALYAAKRPL